MLLLMWTDAVVEATNTPCSRAAARRADGLVTVVHEDLARAFGVRIFEIPAARAALVAGVVPILARLSAGLGSAQFQTGTQSSMDEVASPVALALARRAAVVLSPMAPLATDAVIDLANRIAVVVDSVKRNFQPRRLAVCSGHGLVGAEQLRAEVLDRYPVDRYFAALDAYELYELRGVPVAQYDAVAYDGAFVAYRYDWPVVQLGRPVDGAGLQRFHDVVIAPGFGYRAAAERLGLDDLVVFRNLRVSSLDTLAATVGFRLAADPEAAEHLEADILRSFETSIYSRACVLVLPQHPGATNHFELYELANPVAGGGIEVHHVLLCVVDMQGDNQLLRLLDDVLTQVIHDQDSIETLLSAGSFDPILSRVAARAR
ncbi:MAG: hypothetical protein QM779_15585 [Propionicimonas sp.]|uniref:hypothetical protein n=1 Tax=Propionicimonas sp. TaxID=1955623 RepID=UPI003D101BCC